MCCDWVTKKQKEGGRGRTGLDNLPNNRECLHLAQLHLGIATFTTMASIATLEVCNSRACEHCSPVLQPMLVRV